MSKFGNFYKNKHFVDTDHYKIIVQNTYAVKISRATSAVIGEIVAIEEECRLGRWTAEDYREEMLRETSLILTAKHETEIAGFIASRFAVLNEKSDGVIMYKELDIINFGVLKKYRRQSVGSSLLDALVERALKMRVEAIWLEVRESNFEALNLYKKKGFLAIQTRKNFYAQPPENALVLKLAL